jgi:hypothetical protein
MLETIATMLEQQEMQQTWKQPTSATKLENRAHVAELEKQEWRHK